MSIFFARVLPDIGTYVVEGTKYSSDEINFLGFEDAKGVNFEITGTLHNNFTNIEDDISKLYFKYGGLLIRRLNLKVDDVSLLVYDSKKDEYNDLGILHTSPFSVNTVDGTSTPLDVYMTLYPKSKGVFGTIKRILGDSDASLKLQGDANVKILFLNGYIPLTHVIIPIDIDLR